jgi:micrococcal nuclease
MFSTLKAAACLLAIAITAVGCAELVETTSSDNDPVDTSAFDTGEVIFVVDGDTVILDIGGQEENVRLIGIDTPEARQGSEPVQCFGAEASAYLEQLLPEGTQVRLERDVEARDRFDRLLLYLYKDEVFINKEMVRAGFANARSYRPNTARQNVLDSALAEAKRANVGLWSSCDGPEQPLN